MKNKLLFFVFNFTFLILNSEFAHSANYYWVAGTGSWSDYANHWATSSGGNVFQPHVPTSFDNVYFDANSFTANGQIVTNDTTIAYCLDMDWTGATNNPVFEAANQNIQLKIFGSLTLNPVVNFSFNGQLTFTSFNPGKTIQTFSHILQCPIDFNGAGGEWTMLDSLTTTKDITLTYGTLRTNNNNIRASKFESSNNNARGFYLGTSVVSLNGSGYEWMDSQSLVLDADSSVIKCMDGGVFWSEGHVFNILEFDSTSNSSADNRIEYGNLRFNKIISYNSDVWSTLELDPSFTWADSVIARGNLTCEKGYNDFFNYVFVNRNFELFPDGSGPFWGDSIMHATVNGYTEIGSYGGPNNYFDDFTGYGYLLISQGDGWGSRNVQTFDHCFVGGNATILSADNHMGVFTMTPGKTLTLKNDSTQYIDSLSATGNPGFPIQIVSSDLGHAANVVIQDGLCTDYLYIQAVHAISPNFLFVGANSNDVANNSGWIFTNCVTGMEETYSDGLSVFPNPATSELRIQNLEFGIEKVEIYSAVGQNVFSQKPTANGQQLVVNVSGFSPGIYFVKLKTGQEEYITRFIKQ